VKSAKRRRRRKFWRESSFDNPTATLQWALNLTARPTRALRISPLADSRSPLHATLSRKRSVVGEYRPSERKDEAVCARKRAKVDARTAIRADFNTF